MTWGDTRHDDDHPQLSRTGWVVLTVIAVLLTAITFCTVAATNVWWPI